MTGPENAVAPSVLESLTDELFGYGDHKVESAEVLQQRIDDALDLVGNYLSPASRCAPVELLSDLCITLRGAR